MCESGPWGAIAAPVESLFHTDDSSKELSVQCCACVPWRLYSSALIPEVCLCVCLCVSMHVYVYVFIRPFILRNSIASFQETYSGKAPNPSTTEQQKLE